MARTAGDFLGEKQVPDDAYYGVQTVRGRDNFHITGIPISREPEFVRACGYVKKAAALVALLTALVPIACADRQIDDSLTGPFTRVVEPVTPTC